MDKETNLSISVLQSRELLKYKTRIISPQIGDLPPVEQCFQDVGLWLLDHIRADKGKILIIGDYDVDGIASTAIISKLFKYDIGFETEVIIPSRSDGYGIRLGTLEHLELDNYACIIIVDSGTNVPDVHNLLESNNVPTVILDHHTAGTVLPEYKYVKIINPHLYNGDEQCSASLAYKFATVFNSRNLPEFLGLAAMATLTDCMPLHPNNHSLVKIGLPFLTNNLGINHLIKLNGWGLPTPEIVNWRIGPRLNAPGRMDKATPSLDLLMCETDTEANRLATMLETINQERRNIQDLVLVEAASQAENQTDFIVVYGDWHHGVAGIIASRLAEQYNLPALVLGKEGNLYRGSGRSANKISLINLFKQTSLNPSTYGGHNEAIGATIPSADLENFIKEIKLAAKMPQGKAPVALFDKVITTLDVTRQEAYALEQLAPFGNTYPEPTFQIFGKLTKIDGIWYVVDNFGKCEFLTAYRSEPIVTDEAHIVNIKLGYSGRVVVQTTKT